MGSDHCAGIVETSLRRLPGVSEVATNIANHRVTVQFDAGRTAAAELRRAIERAGYDVAAVENEAAASPRAGRTPRSATWLRPGERFWIAAYRRRSSCC
jgi:P-type Cu+ transporter